MHFGCAWYPEHWPEARWATDLEMMRRAGMTVVRVAEFAWSRMEPAEGRFELDWLHRAIDQAGTYGIQSVVGTPTATPPAWLTQKYPDVLGIDNRGQRRVHGGRCHYSVSSPRYREFCRRIASEMAQRLGRHPRVIGWQIDNEYNAETFDEHTRQCWHRWLKDRFTSLDELNRRWTTAYWSLEYSDWSQVPMSGDGQNPCLKFEWKRFMTAMYREYQQVQVQAIRASAEPRQWITHNIHAWDNLDFAAITSDLDIAANDIYIGPNRLDPGTVGWMSDMTRGMSGKPDRPTPHWIMECQPNHVIYGDVPTHLDPGELRRMVWHFVGHGAAGVLFWQWRAALGSHEQYWGTILAPDGTPRPTYQEISRVGAELAKVSPLLASAPPPRGEVALLHTYADRWIHYAQRHHQGFDYKELLATWYAALRRQGLDVDVIDPRLRPIDGYAMVLAPSLHMLDDELAERLARYVRAGGHLVLGPRSGMKDLDNGLLPSRQPGQVLGELLGGHVSDFYPIRQPHPVAGELGSFQSRIWAEPLVVRAGDAQVLLRFGPVPADVHGQGWLPGQPAALTRAAGAGRLTYIGAWLDAPGMDAVTSWAAAAAGLTLTPPPKDVEVCRRPTATGGRLTIVINHGSAPAQVAVPPGRIEVLSGEPLPQALSLAAGEVCAYETR